MKKSSKLRPGHHCDKNQPHVHEFLGSVKLAEEGEDRHNHRSVGVSGQVIPLGSTHVHEIVARTDFLDHFHDIIDRSGPAIWVGNNKHVHLVEGNTNVVDDHCHVFVFTTLIESPLTPAEKCPIVASKKTTEKLLPGRKHIC
jgi:hypothetical protein